MRNDNGVTSRSLPGQRLEGDHAAPTWLVSHAAITGSLPSPDGLLKTDGHGVILEANDAAAHLLHCSLAFLIGKPLGLMLAKESRVAFYDFLTQTVLHGESRVLELRLWRPNVMEHDVLAMVEREEAAAGMPALLRWQLRDVTSMRRIELALRSERQLLDSVIDAAQAIILVLDGQGRVLRANRYLYEVSGHPLEDLHACFWDEVLVQPVNRLVVRRMIREAVQQGAGHTGPLAMPTRHGGPRSVVWSARGIPGGVVGTVVVLGNDVTDLQRAQEHALRAERLAAIGQVAAGLAHEGRNALQRIQACLSILTLRLGNQSPDLVDLVARAERAQDDLRHLFEDVLGYAAAPRLARRPCDLGTVWREAWADLEATRHGRTAELIEEMCDIDLTCEIDAFQMKRVFRNLFENALAACADPVRVVVACREGNLQGQAAVCVRVRDNGPGFPAEVRRHLFEPFHTTKIRGTGLGLAICQRLVEAHGGRIEPGDAGPGAEIVIHLPRRMP